MSIFQYFYLFMSLYFFFLKFTQEKSQMRRYSSVNNYIHGADFFLENQSKNS